LDFGIDLNEDGELSEDEITSTAFVCNGLDGQDGNDGVDGTSALVEVTAVQPGEDCQNGGVLVTNGYDLNNNGTLEENEIAGSTLVCNGLNGTDGENGFNSLVKTIRIEGGDNCPNGGFIIVSGLDLNRNNILDDSEIVDTNTQYVCDGEDGKSLAIRVEYLEGENQYCGNGGYLVTIGLDQNGDGELDDSEAEDGTSFPVCNGYDGQDGEDGYNSLISTEKVTDEETGNIIGTVIYYGLDINRNGTLEVEERNSSFTILDGAPGQDGTDGYNLLVKSYRNTVEGYENETVILFGLDINRNGELDVPDEVTSVVKIYDGVNGPAGQDGRSVTVRYEYTETGVIVIFGYLVDETFTEINRITITNGVDGEDGNGGGKTLITNVTEVSEESSCTNGGTLVQVGYDDNGNGELDSEEVVDSFEVCNGVDGTDGENGENGVCEECEAACEGGTVCIYHKLKGGENSNTFDNVSEIRYDRDGHEFAVILTLTFSEFVYHTYEAHSGSSSQGDHDGWIDCNEIEDNN
jgi:hypothetical protein